MGIGLDVGVGVGVGALAAQFTRAYTRARNDRNILSMYLGAHGPMCSHVCIQVRNDQHITCIPSGAPCHEFALTYNRVRISPTFMFTYSGAH